LTPESYSLLNDLDLNSESFAQCTGNIIQLQKHAEIVFLANEFGSFHALPRLQTLVRTMYGFVDAARECNNDGFVNSTIQITDFCWNMLQCTAEYAKAIGIGGVEGVLSVVNMLCHPREIIEHIGSALCHAGSFVAGVIADSIIFPDVEDCCVDYYLGLESPYSSEDL